MSKAASNASVPRDLSALEQLSQNPLEEKRVTDRAGIVLACLRKEPIAAICAQFQVSRSMVFRWRARFLEEGLAGLWDKPHTGKPPRYDEKFEQRVLEALALPPPADRACWDGQSLAEYLEASDDAVWRVLRRHGVALARQRVWSVKSDLRFPGAAKMVAGLYIAPPVRLMALRKPQSTPTGAQIYTRNRAAGEALLEAAGAERMLHLPQAMDILLRHSQTKTNARKQREEILHFLNDCLEGTKPFQALTILAVGSPASLDLSGWMAAHQEVRFVFYENIENVEAHLELHLPRIGEAYGQLVRKLIDYPADATPLLWKAIHRDWMGKEAREQPESNEKT